MGTMKTWELIAGLAAFNKPEKVNYTNLSYLKTILDTLDANIIEANSWKEDKEDQDKESKLLENYLKFADSRKQLINNEHGTKCNFYIYNDSMEPLIADIRIYEFHDNNIDKQRPMNEEDIEELRKQLYFYRRVTNKNGYVSLYLPKGKYELFVAKGSEYELKHLLVEVSEQEQDFNIKLLKFTDLASQGYYAGDLHHHSVYSSPLYGGTDFVVDQVSDIKQSMLAAGLSFGALSDHHNILNHTEWKSTEELGFLPIISKEISTSNGHVLALGVREDVIYQIPRKEERNDEYLRNEFIRITDKIKELKGLPQLNHPRDAQVAISFNPEYTDIIHIFDTIEVWNGAYPFEMFTPNHKAFQLWLSLLDEGRFIAATTGSDTHDINGNLIFTKVDEIMDYMKKIISSYESFSIEVKQIADEFLDMVMIALPTFKKCHQYASSSGGVRTYIHSRNEILTEGLILDELRNGHSFLTNGPILIPSINSKGIGETLTITNTTNKVDMELKILSNRKLKTLYLWKSSTDCEMISLPDKDRNEMGYYDYSGIYSTKMNDNGYIVFMVKEDCSCMAITNPIFITVADKTYS